MTEYQDPFANSGDGEKGIPMKFPEIGSFVEGEVVNFFHVQDTDYDTGEPLWTDKAQTKPKNLLVVVLQTDLRGTHKYVNRKWVAVETDDDDTGLRTLFVKGALWLAIAEARKGKTFGIGGKLKVEYYADGEAKPKKNPPKLYRAEYSEAVEKDPFSD